MKNRAIALCFLAAASCKHFPSESEIRSSQIHYDLGVQATQQGDSQGAYRELERALELNPSMPEAHNALALLLHLSFRRLEAAIGHYQKAIELRPEFSEAKTNLANVFLDQGRYDDAIQLYEQALNDMLYPTPFIAQGNLGWALYKKGEVAKAINTIKSAVTTNPGFCLGHMWLGVIYDSQQNLELSCKSFSRYRESCPEVADAHLREGVCLAKSGKPELAKRSFESCLSGAKNEQLKEDCRRLREELGP